MADETYGFETARVRLEEIAAQARRKDVSLEKSLDLLEEGVRLANLCTEQIDHTQWTAVVETAPEPAAEESETTAEDVVPAEAEGVSAEEDAVPCEVEPAGADSPGDVPVEDSHGASEEPPGEDPDVEA